MLKHRERTFSQSGIIQPPPLPQKLSHGYPAPTIQHHLKKEGAIKALQISKLTQISHLQANESKSHINWHSPVLK